MSKITKEVIFELTPNDLALAFCEMDGVEQAQFFTSCAECACMWGPGKAQAQWSWLSVQLTNEGREVVRAIMGEDDTSKN